MEIRQEQAYVQLFFRFTFRVCNYRASE